MKHTLTNLIGGATIAALVLITNPLRASEPKANELTPQFTAAGISIDSLRAVEVGGIVVLRGRAIDRATSDRAASFALSLGYTRVANLIQIIEPIDDERIERLAERQLGMQRSLDGSQLHVDSDNGIVHLTGKVKYELQKDVAMQVVRNIDGVRSVSNEMQR
jgi:osmotically-inducible protein OsmY